MLNILHRDFPDVATIISERINEMMPDKIITDASLMPAIIHDFIQVTEIGQIVWRNSKDRVSCRLSQDEYRLCKVTEVRELLIAVVLMFFHPERILNLTNSRARCGIIKNLSALLKCDKDLLSKIISNVISYYKTYRTFREEVQYLYSQVNEKGNYFKIAG